MCQVVEDPATLLNNGPLRISIILSEEEKAYNRETLNIIKSKKKLKKVVKPVEIVVKL